MAPRVVVVGNGLIGSAAARWLTEFGADAVVVGPAEPVDHSTHGGVFSSHYDEGRLVSAYGFDPTWSDIARRAIGEFAGIERRSGVPFHRPVGRLSVVAAENHEAVRSWAERVDPTGGDLRLWSPADTSWQEEFPYLDVPDGMSVLHEGPPAGLVNPRSMLRAQNLVAEQGGARLLDDRATSVRLGPAGAEVSTAGGETIHADRVIVAAGAFTNFADLVPVAVPIRLKTETTVWATVTAETARRCSAMPVTTYDIDDPDIDDIYLAPPIRYPDGVHRIKMGCNTSNESWPTTLDEVGAWFRHGDSDRDLEPMERALRSLLPDIEILDVTTHRCIVTYTPSGFPMIDHAPGDEHRRLVVAVGGNGTGAQGSDTLGRLAAGLVYDGRWPQGFEREVFSAQTRWDEPTRRLSNAQRRARRDQSADTA